MKKLDRYIVAAAALLWLASCGGNTDETAVSPEDLKSDNLVIRLMAIEDVGKTRDSSAVPALIELLQDSFEEVRLQSVISLGNIRSREAVPALVDQLNDPSLEVRREVVTALGKLKDPEAVPSLSLLVEGELKLAAIWALGNIGDRAAIPVLNELMTSDDPYVRYNASKALAKIP